MLRQKLFYILALFGGVLYSADMVAQSGDSSRIDFDYVKYSDGWLTGYNAAGLLALPVYKASYADIYYNKNNGQFINYSQSDNSYDFGAHTEAFLKLNEKIAFYGNVEYSSFKGKHMGGAVFVNPDNAPFNIVEYADSTRGDKKLEKYHLVGAISANVYRGLALGAKVDYLAANYAKHKDLRHKNNLMDMYVTVGAAYRLNKIVQLGANYFYRRSTEGIEFKMYGNKDQTFNSLVDFGAFWGRRELYSESGYTTKERNTPLFNEYNGFSVQADIVLGNISLYNEFTYKSRDGYYGDKSTGSIVYSEHNSKIYEYDAMFRLKSKLIDHWLKVGINHEKLENNENSYSIENLPNGNQEIRYYGKNTVLDKKVWKANAEYTANINIENYIPTWVIAIRGDYMSRKQTVSLYPYFRKQDIHTYSIRVHVDRNIKKDIHIYTISLHGQYAGGGGTMANNGTYVQPSQSQTEPAHIDSYLYREYEYLTSKNIRADIAFKYSRLIDKKAGITGYIGVSYSLTKAFDLSYLSGSTYGIFGLKAGCMF